MDPARGEGLLLPLEVSFNGPPMIRRPRGVLSPAAITPLAARHNSPASLRQGASQLPTGSRCREAVRSAPLVRARGRLGRREGVVNVLVTELQPRQLGEQSKAQVRRMVPIEDGGEHGDLDELAMRRRAREMAVAELRAVVPAGHSFGRRGR